MVILSGLLDAFIIPLAQVMQFFLENLEIMCEEIMCGNTRSILVGDFNLDFLSEEFYVKKIKNIFHLYGITQYVKTVTRVTNNSSTLIDYVLSNTENLNVNTHLSPKISDHYVISINFTNIIKEVDNFTYYKQARNLNEVNLNKINSKLLECTYMLNCTDVNIVFANLLENCTLIVDQIAPLKTFKHHGNDIPWYDLEIKQKTVDRDKAYKFFKSFPNDENWQHYKHKRNIVVNLIKTKKKQFYWNKIDQYRNNPRLMWKTLKKLINPKNFSNISANGIFFENNDQTELIMGEQIAEYFNNYFVNSIDHIVNSVEKQEFICTITCQSTITNFKLLNMPELAKIVKELDNKGSVIPILSSTLLKSSFEVIGHVWLHFVNTSLETGNFPKDLKVSTVTPIEKVNNTIKSWEFRPINSLPHPEKLLEMVVYQQLLEYFNENNIIFENQSGFREKHSCESALQVTITEWKQKMDIGYYTIAVYLDLKRAFETIDRGILIEKIYHYGVRGKLKLNISKTKAMLISTPYKYKQINLNEITLTIDNTRIEIVEETKYLGLVIDSHLNFTPHFNYIHKKISKKIYFFSRVSQNLSCNTRITVYNTIIKTHFEYCATVLYSLDLNKMLALQKLQNRAMRIILKCNRYTPISNMLSCLQWLNSKVMMQG
ncbi:hypothetical protein NQ317_016706 [Molorchus minor]|uniref:Reverse transcriptase domain-containing protein n=1 Tax=Molorchus minor TaxID=1323400 RepID=A0ABQ9J615_9CUCU|nr:hypothetical protein NQ317_016706 [Molorchus minor]